MLTVISAGTIAVGVNCRRLKTVHLDLTFVSRIIIAENLAAKPDGLIIQLDDFCLDNLTLIEQLLPFLQYGGREVLSEFPKIQHKHLFTVHLNSYVYRFSKTNATKKFILGGKWSYLIAIHRFDQRISTEDKKWRTRVRREINQLKVRRALPWVKEVDSPFLSMMNHRIPFSKWVH